jgi:hypothetical protein
MSPVKFEDDAVCSCTGWVLKRSSISLMGSVVQIEDVSLTVSLLCEN